MGKPTTDAVNSFTTVKRGASTAVKAAHKYVNAVLRNGSSTLGAISDAQEILRQAEKLYDMVRG
jgi:hypothetical protein